MEIDARSRSKAVAILAAAFLFACAAPGPRVLHFDYQESAPDARPMWPSPPEVPRFMYVGQLLGEANFRDPEKEDSGLAGWLRRLAQLIVGEPVPTVLRRPQAGTVDASGRILVTDASHQAVLVFDRAAGELLIWNKAEGLENFSAPSGIAIGPQGDVLVTDAQLGLVARLDARGNPGRAIGRGQLKRPTGIAYDAAERRIFVADTYAHEIKVFDENGGLLKTIGRQGEGEGEFNFPSHLAFVGGELYVTDTMNSRVQAFAEGGERWRMSFGRRGLFVGNLVRPKGVAVDSDGNVYVIESYFDHLLVFNRQGEFLMAIGGLGPAAGNFYLPAGAWIDGGNRVYVADMFNGRIVIFQYLETGGDGG